MRGSRHETTIQPDTILEWTGHTTGVFSVQVCRVWSAVHREHETVDDVTVQEGA
jgi:hypothetical protein